MPTENDRRSGTDRRRGDARPSGPDRRSNVDRRSGSKRRSEVRAKKRIPCQVVISEQRYRGFVLDVSMHGLFEQTRSAIDPGTKVGVEFCLPEVETEIVLCAMVARCRRAPPGLEATTAAGIGVRVTQAPSEYYEFLSELTSTEPSRNPAPSTSPPTPEGTIELVVRTPTEPPVKAKARYNVKVKHVSGPHSGTLVVRAGSRERAESLLLDELGDDWEVLHVDAE